jgi:hypothetical protein
MTELFRFPVPLSGSAFWFRFLVPLSGSAFWFRFLVPLSTGVSASSTQNYANLTGVLLLIYAGNDCSRQ